MSLVVVTGVPGSGKTTLGSALARRLGCAFLSLDEIKEELAAEAPETPRDWLRFDAEGELVRRVKAFEGEAVVDIWIAPRRDTARVAGLLAPWWSTLVEVQCAVPADVAVARYAARERGWPHLPADEQTLRRIRTAVAHPDPLDAPRTVVVDTTRRVAVASLARTLRAETRGRLGFARP
ncbi:AAA family ATPase [Nocardioides cynanchi]|uniref:AAA family ATPase n=1 Tax=Nocardioides cynanchi TaxID=2558918 RepID=UPI0012465F4E|nr:AAA family ATPase [Nocardioides cynanchi]